MKMGLFLKAFSILFIIPLGYVMLSRFVAKHLRHDERDSSLRSHRPDVLRESDMSYKVPNSFITVFRSLSPRPDKLTKIT
jgi:hypothetical protein